MRCIMLRTLRISFQLVTFTLLIGFFFLMAPDVVHAAVSPFLKNPYFGATLPIYSYFDHDIPTNNYGYCCDNPYVVTYQGGAAQNVNYTNHAGYDYLMSWQPVLAAAGGSVTQAQWNSATDHSYGCGLYV